MRSKQGTFYKISNSPISIGMGNVLSTVSDKKIPVDNGNNGTIDWYIADITSASDYYPFGSPMDGRTFSSEKYRFGFNGQEKDDEVAGAGNINTAEFWEYDTRLGRRWNTDPLEMNYPFQSPYLSFNNNPLLFKDPNGKEGVAEVNKEARTVTVTSKFYYDKSNPDFKSYGITEGTDPEKSQLTLKDESGWNSQVREFKDQDGQVWTVTYKIEYIPLNSEKEVDKKMSEDKTANRLVFRSSWTAAAGNQNEAAKWKPSSRTMELSPGLRPDGSTITHEEGHALGLPHEPQNYFSPNFGVEGNLENKDNAGIMSYANSRQIMEYEVKLMLNSAVCIAKKQQGNIVKIHIHGSFTDNTFEVMK